MGPMMLFYVVFLFSDFSTYGPYGLVPRGAGFVSYVEVLGPARGHWVFRMQGSVAPRWVIDGHVQLMLDPWGVNGTRYTLPSGTGEPSRFRRRWQ